MSGWDTEYTSVWKTWPSTATEMPSDASGKLGTKMRSCVMKSPLRSVCQYVGGAGGGAGCYGADGSSLVPPPPPIWPLLEAVRKDRRSGPMRAPLPESKGSSNESFSSSSRVEMSPSWSP